MERMTPELSKLVDDALMLTRKDRIALTESLISSLKGKVDEDVIAAWEAEIAKRIAQLDSGEARTVPWEEVRARNLKKLPHAQ